MRPSKFAPIGLFRLRRGPPIAQRIYEDMVRSLGGEEGPLRVTQTSHWGAHCYATAIETARAKRRLEVAKNQAHAKYITHLLPNREAEYGIVPTVDQSMEERRAELARRMLVPEMPTQAAIETALTDLLGDDFIAYRPTPSAEAIITPSTVGDAPANLARPDVTRKVVQLTSAVAFVGTPVTVGFSYVELPTSGPANENTDLVVGDTLVFDPGHSIADRVTVSAVSGSTLTATFSMAHDAGARGYTHPIPSQTSTKRDVLVVLSDAAASDPVKRNQVNDYLGRTVRASTRWFIAAGDATSTTPFDLTTSNLPATSLTTITL